MRKFLFTLLVIASIQTIAQKREVNLRKTYYFMENTRLQKCDATGNPALIVNSGTGAIASAVLNGNAVGIINLTSGGSGYTSAPIINITGGGGSGATATALLTGIVQKIDVTAGGSGYVNPVIKITDGGGNGAVATAIVSSGVITGFQISNGGSGYTSTPNVTITEVGGSGATASATLTKAVQHILVTSPGSGYTSSPTVSITLNVMDEVTAFKNFEFKVDKIVGNYIVIHFLKWNEGDRSKSFVNKSNRGGIDNPEATENNKEFYGDAKLSRPRFYFLVPLATFLSETSVGEISPRVALMIGTATMPIKIRFADKEDVPLEQLKDKYFDFQGSINVGLNAGFSINLNGRKGIHKDYINLLGGVGISSVPVDSFTTRGFAKQATNTASLTWSTTIMYQRDNFQAGLFLGKDYLAGEMGRQWKYRNDLWMGIGLGFSLVKTKKTTDEQ